MQCKGGRAVREGEARFGCSMVAADLRKMRQTGGMNEQNPPIEDEGGDAACWAHQFEEVQGADLGAIAATTAVRGPAWRLTDAELNANLLVFDTGQGIETHRNDSVDVLVLGVAGRGTLTIEGKPYPLWAGRLLLAPKGSERSIVADSDGFAYLTCHKARAPLLPTTQASRPARD